MSITVLILAVLGRLLAYLLMYAAYRPYTDSLAVKVLLGVVSFGVLVSLVGTAARGEPATAIAVNFLLASAGIAVAFVIFHAVDRWLFAPRPR